MSRLALLSVALLLVVAPSALLVAPDASAAPMPPATHRAISKLIDNFVKDIVLRRNLAAGWTLVGPDLRGGTTRAAWVRGTGVTVQRFPALGNDFSNAWALTSYDGPRNAELTVNLRSGGKNPEVIAATAAVIKQHGRWIVNDFYTAGIFRLGAGHRGSCAQTSCKVTGINDFGAGSSAHELGLATSNQSRWMWRGLGGAGGAIAATVLGALLYTRLRDRRARRAFEAHMGRR